MAGPLASFPIVKTTDPDQAQSVLSRELSGLRFRSVSDVRQFRLEMNGVRFGRTMLGFNKFATDSQVDAGVIENAVIVSVSVGTTPAILDLDGEQVGDDQVGIVAPDRHTIIHRAPGSGVVLLRADMASIDQRFRELTGKEVSRPIRFARSTSRRRGIGKAVNRLLASVINDIESTEAFLANPILKAGLDDTLLSAILSLPNSHTDLLQEPGRDEVPPQIVLRAETYLEANAMQPITISDVVTECGGSRRALFNAFQKHRGYTPMQFLTQARLKAARRELARASATDTVASIATSCGFAHLGRFAEAYYRQFGEKPSDTMRRGRD